MDNVALFFLIFSLNNKNPTLDQIMIFAAEYLIYLIILFIFLLAFKGGIKERKTLLLSLVSIPIVILLIKFMHLFFIEQRPFIEYNISPLISHQSDASFPSRHSAIAFTIAFSYIFYKSRWAFVFIIAAILIGVSRVYVGVHYPLDIIGGIIFGLVAVMISWNIKNKLFKN